MGWWFFFRLENRGVGLGFWILKGEGGVMGIDRGGDCGEIGVGVGGCDFFWVWLGGFGGVGVGEWVVEGVGKEGGGCEWGGWGGGKEGIKGDCECGRGVVCEYNFYCWWKGEGNYFDVGVLWGGGGGYWWWCWGKVEGRVWGFEGCEVEGEEGWWDVEELGGGFVVDGVFCGEVEVFLDLGVNKNGRVVMREGEGW